MVGAVSGAGAVVGLSGDGNVDGNLTLESDVIMTHPRQTTQCGFSAPLPATMWTPVCCAIWRTGVGSRSQTASTSVFMTWYLRERVE